MTIRRFVSAPFSVNSYLIAENAFAVLVDPIPAEELICALQNLTVERIFLTHEHYDHILGAPEMRRRTGAKVYCGIHAEKGLERSAVNLSRYAAFLSGVIPFAEKTVENADFSCKADLLVKDGETLVFHHHTIRVLETPGHSAGSVSYLLDDIALFSGDTVFSDYPTALKLPGGNKKAFYEITVPLFENLPQTLTVYPGHGETFLLKDRYGIS